VTVAGAFVLLGLLAIDAAGGGVLEGRGTEPLLVVAVPSHTTGAMLEALNRLRGEAASVGFAVRVVDSDAEALPLLSLEKHSRSLQPAAVVTLTGMTEGAEPHSLDISFFDRGTGRFSVAHVVANDPGTADRDEVVMAVRAVDFIRARMLETLTSKQMDAAPSKPPPASPQASPPLRRKYLAAGLGVLGNRSGFSPAWTPQLEAGYRSMPWLRVGVMVLGRGSRPQLDDSKANGSVGIDQTFVGLSATLLGREWYGLQPAFELGGGEYWVTVRGSAELPAIGQTTTLSSPGAFASAGLALKVLPFLAVEAHAGTLWLQNRPEIESTPHNHLASLGRPIWLGRLHVAASF